MTKRVLGDNAELMGVYKPRTQETKQTYEVILAFIQEALGDQVCIFYPPENVKAVWKFRNSYKTIMRLRKKNQIENIGNKILEIFLFSAPRHSVRRSWRGSGCPQVRQNPWKGQEEASGGILGRFDWGENGRPDQFG